MCRASTRLIALIVLAASLTVPLPGMKRRSVCIFGSDIFIPNALHGKVYDLPDGTFHLPVFDHMKPVGQVYATALNIPPQDFEEYFPGVRSRVEWFGIDYQGYFWIRNPGEYRFSLTSDDGATLMIDDRMIINNDGLHPPKEERGKITLTAGSHYMRIEYFQGIRTLVAPVLTWQCPLHLAPGFYTIETAVVDWQGDRSSAQVAYFHNRPRRGLALSDVVLIRQIEDDRSGARDPFQTQGKRVTPWLASVLGSGATPYVYFIVAPDKAIREKPTLTVQLVRNGEVAATQTAPLPPPDASGRIPMLIGTAAQSGSWEVQIGVVQGGETTAQRVAYTIR